MYNTPQQNGVVECTFATIYGRARVAFVAARLLESLKKCLWAKGVETTTRLDNEWIDKSEYRSIYKMIFGEKWLTPGLLHSIGERAAVASRKAIKAKLAN